MSVQAQHILVYLAVGIAVYQLFSPVFFWIIRKYQKWKDPIIQEDPFSCYTGSCAKCSVRDNA